MAFSITAPHRIWLFSHNSTHKRYTGGWKRVEKEITANDYIAEAPFQYTVYNNYLKNSMPRDVGGSMVLVIQTSHANRKVQRIKIRTEQMVDFMGNDWLRFLFTLDHLGRKEEVFKKTIRINILDKDLNVVRYWDAMDKNCQYERGEMNLRGIRSGYIEVMVQIELNMEAAKLKT